MVCVSFVVRCTSAVLNVLLALGSVAAPYTSNPGLAVSHAGAYLLMLAGRGWTTRKRIAFSACAIASNTARMSTGVAAPFAGLLISFVLGEYHEVTCAPSTVARPCVA